MKVEAPLVAVIIDKEDNVLVRVSDPTQKIWVFMMDERLPFEEGRAVIPNNAKREEILDRLGLTGKYLTKIEPVLDGGKVVPIRRDK